MLASSSLSRLSKSCNLYLTTRLYSSSIRFKSPDDLKVLKECSTNVNYNIPSHIKDKIDQNLHLKQNHPLNTISNIILDYFQKDYYRAHTAKLQGLNPPTKPNFTQFTCYDSLSPIVTIQQHFDDLLIPEDHVSRKPTDTYYIDEKRLLRSHTSAHQTELMRIPNNNAFLAVGDVYRRDTVDITHFPVFHQMEGVRIFEPHPQVTPDFVVQDLKDALSGMVKRLFGDVEIRWIDAYFPFTHPSFEMEILFNDNWLEVFGSGVIQKAILTNTGHDGKLGWAFGLGLERLGMILFDIPDIRLFWSNDDRFIRQFEKGKITKFKPFSKHPACFKDIAFWLPTEKSFHENDFFELIRQFGGGLVEDAKLIDKFVHPKTKRESCCYRLNFRAMDRNLTNEEIDVLQFKIRDEVVEKLGVELR